MKRCMQYFCIGLMLSFQLTAQASIKDNGSMPVNFNGLEHFKYSNGIFYITLGRDGLKFFHFLHLMKLKNALIKWFAVNY